MRTSPRAIAAVECSQRLRPPASAEEQLVHGIATRFRAVRRRRHQSVGNRLQPRAGPLGHALAASIKSSSRACRRAELRAGDAQHSRENVEQARSDALRVPLASLQLLQVSRRLALVCLAADAGLLDDLHTEARERPPPRARRAARRAWCRGRARRGAARRRPRGRPPPGRTRAPTSTSQRTVSSAGKSQPSRYSTSTRCTAGPPFACGRTAWREAGRPRTTTTCWPCSGREATVRSLCILAQARATVVLNRACLTRRPCRTFRGSAGCWMDHGRRTGPRR